MFLTLKWRPAITRLATRYIKMCAKSIWNQSSENADLDGLVACTGWISIDKRWTGPRQKEEGTSKNVVDFNSRKDLDLLGVTWEEALDLTRDRSDWSNCTAMPDVRPQHKKGLRVYGKACTK